MAEKTVEMTLLFDFFGDLLTDKQREYFDYYYNDDLSLSEIAEIGGISRQGVRDILRRAESLLIEYEEKTGVVDRFKKMSSGLALLETRAREIVSLTDGKARELALEIVSGLEELIG